MDSSIVVADRAAVQFQQQRVYRMRSRCKVDTELDIELVQENDKWAYSMEKWCWLQGRLGE